MPNIRGKKMSYLKEGMKKASLYKKKPKKKTKKKSAWLSGFIESHDKTVLF